MERDQSTNGSLGSTEDVSHVSTDKTPLHKGLLTVHEITVTEKAQQPTKKKRSNRGWMSPRFIAANVFCLILLAWTIVIVPLPIYLSRASEFDNTKRTVYTVFITVIASCPTFYLVSHMRSEWLLIIDQGLPEQISPTGLAPLNRHWRTALGISSLKERWAERKTWPMQFFLMFAALSTSALVAAMTPTNAEQEVSFFLDLPHGEETGCTWVVNDGNATASAQYYQNMSWPADDGNRLVALEAATCPPGQVLGLMGQLNDAAPNQYVYSTLGTAIHASAIGAHQSIVTYKTKNYTTPLQNATNAVGTDLTHTKQCVPVLSSNPFTCRHDGSMTFPQANQVYLSNGPTCNHTALMDFNVTRNTSHAVSASVCPGDKIGAGMAIFGATNEYALGLAGALGDVKFAEEMVLLSAGGVKDGAPVNYTVVCDFDVAKSISWRYATLDLQHTPSEDVPFSRMLYANESCAPLADVGAQYAAMAASGLSAPLAEYTPATAQLAALTYHILAHPGVPSVAGTNGFARTGPWAFNGSTNALEDVLGLIAGLAMSQVPSVDATSVPDFDAVRRVPMMRQQGSSGVQVIRIGPGKAWALVFAVPPFLAWVCIVWLHAKVVRGQPVYHSSQLMDLIRLGRSSGYSHEV